MTTPGVAAEGIQGFELLDRKLLNLVQSSLPLVPQPYEALGNQLGVPEQEVIERLGALKRKRVIRQISAIFDTRRLGYKTALIAMGFAPEKLHKGALVINRHPGVSHNYGREGHRFNLWFTVAVAAHESLEATVETMARDTGATEYRLLPTIRFFKIGVNFDMVQGQGSAVDYNPDSKNWNKVEPVSEFEVEAIRELQEDLALEPRPFDGMAQRLGITVEGLSQLAEDFHKRGVMRRFSAVLHHRKAGFKYNAMSVWRVPAERAEEVGRILASSPWVSHCYERPTFPDWPYGHFAMLHATTKEKCDQIAQGLSEAANIEDFLLLYSSREYKKTRVRYFV